MVCLITKKLVHQLWTFWHHWVCSSKEKKQFIGWFVWSTKLKTFWLHIVWSAMTSACIVASVYTVDYARILFLQKTKGVTKFRFEFKLWLQKEVFRNKHSDLEIIQPSVWLVQDKFRNKQMNSRSYCEASQRCFLTFLKIKIDTCWQRFNKHLIIYAYHY